MTEPVRAHAKLSASGSERWLKCPGSIRLEAPFPDSTSSYAEEGTLAHEIVELMIKHQFIEPMKPRTYSAALGKLKKHPLFQPEMLNHAETYIDHIHRLVGLSKNPVVMSEQRVSFGRWVTDGFGTCDTIIVTADSIYIIDFKYGKGVPVSAENNSQLKLYALGAYDLLSDIYDIKHVCVSIVQPRLDSISSEIIPTADLLEFGEFARAQAEKALTDNAEVNPGDWCRFCKAKAVCKVRAEKNIELAGFTKIPTDTLTAEEIGRYIKQGEDVAKWLADLKEHALNELLKGEEIPGWKVVEGRSVRTWTDETEALKAVVGLGFDEALLYERKPLSLSAIEKLMGKKEFEQLDKFIARPPGKPTLAEETDKRPAFKNVDVTKIFNQENES
jgi:hypothetical protein